MKQKEAILMLNWQLIIIALTTLLAMSGTGASAQAFGIEKGNPIGSLNVVREVDEFYYIVTVPKPHPEFESYSVRTSSETGVCQVTGIGKDHDSDRYGTSVKSAFSSLSNSLNNIYGANKSYDFIQNGALWDEPNEWVMSLKQNERFYRTYWNEEHKSDIPEGLKGIGLGVYATSSDSAYVKLTYEFDNFDVCLKISESQDESGL
tara:strand:+ start:279 stop:893 length:615 start_codon:yes stop_codon:yes gene_type:complete